MAVRRRHLPAVSSQRRTGAYRPRKGLEPLAAMIFVQKTNPPIDPEAEAAAFVSEEKGVGSVEEALAGARDIIAETVSEDQHARAEMRELFTHSGSVNASVVKGKHEEGAKYKDYFEWSEWAINAPSHRVLAMMRGENEGFLKLNIAPPEDAAMARLQRRFVRGITPASEQVDDAVQDSYKRLLAPSMETEIRAELKRVADEESIRVFAANLRELLLPRRSGRRTCSPSTPASAPGARSYASTARHG